MLPMSKYIQKTIDYVMGGKHCKRGVDYRVGLIQLVTVTRLFQSFIKRRFSFTTFCACANFVNINISANALWQSPLKSYDFK